MICAFHIQTAAKVTCSSCNRGLCSACDHRIKGNAYCQDCIVAGIESLHRGPFPYANTQANSYAPSRSKGRPLLAAVCALIPGGGAVYNRQNLKAIIQFVGIVGMFQLADLPPLQFLAIGGILLYFYSILDSFRTARAIALGESASENEERFKRGLIKRAPTIGGGLIIAGLLVFIRLVQPLNAMLSFSRLAPVALIIFGGYLLTRYFKQSREVRPDYSDRPPYQLVSGRLADRSSQRTTDSRFDR